MLVENLLIKLINKEEECNLYGYFNYKFCIIFMA